MLRRGPEVGRVSDYAVFISPAAADRARGNLGPIASFHDQIMGYRFVEKPNLRDIREFANSIESLMPPRNLWGNDYVRDIAMIQARYGVDAMMQMMEDIKNIAMASGGNIEPATVTAIVVTAGFVYKVVSDYLEEPSPYSDEGDYDGDGIPTEQIRTTIMMALRITMTAILSIVKKGSRLKPMFLWYGQFDAGLSGSCSLSTNGQGNRIICAGSKHQQ